MKVRRYGKVIGEIEGSMLTKYVAGSKHKLIKMNAWAIDKVLLNEYKDEIKEVRVIDTEAKITYTVSVDILLDKGIRIDFGYGEQIALPLRYWEKEQK